MNEGIRVIKSDIFTWVIGDGFDIDIDVVCAIAIISRQKGWRYKSFVEKKLLFTTEMALIKSKYEYNSFFHWLFSHHWKRDY